MAPDKNREPRSDKNRKPRSQDDLIDWFTVRYRTIYMVAFAILALAGAGGYYYYQKHAAASPPPSTAPPAPSTSARFASMDGSVQVKVAGTLQWVSADKSMVLNKSDLVRTGSGATAEIRFFDGTVFHVRPDSLITIEETSEDPGSKQRRVAAKISSGEVNFQTVPSNVPGSATRISTPTVEATAGGDAAGNILVADSGQSGIKMFRGTAVGQTKTGERIALNPNEGVTVDPAGKAGPKVVLPGIPVLLAPPHQSEISYPDAAKATTLLAWKPVPSAASYHLMLDYNATFNRPLVDRKDWRTGSMELRGLEVGTYYWKVAATDKDGVEGAFSDFFRFAVTKPSASAIAVPPPLTVESLDPRGNILQVKGRTEPGASLTVNGQRVDVQSDGTFNEFITVAPGRQIVVIRAIGINGGVNEQKRPVAVPF